MTKQSRTLPAPSDNEIAFYAYCLWEADGRPHGKHNEHWFQARAQLTAHRQEVQPPARLAPAVEPDVQETIPAAAEEKNNPRKRAAKAVELTLAAA